MVSIRAIHSISMAFFVLLASCAPVGDEAAGDEAARAAPAPLSWVDDGADRADRDCGVVLRGASRLPGPTGLEVDCSTGRCWFVWGFEVDLADGLVEAGASPAVLYRSGSSATWWEAGPASSTGSPVEGYRRYLVRVFEHTVDSGMSMTSLMRTRLEAIPFARLPGGGRLFDHNRMPGDFDVYALTPDNGWAVAEDPGVCSALPAPRAAVGFLAGWTEVQHGAIVQGGTLRLEYDPARLAECRASYTFAPAWDIEAQGRFLPGGQTFSGSVVAFATTETGLRLDRPSPGALEVEVPRDATAVEVWFRNWSAMSSPCEAWDSRFGDNYRFEVLPRGPAAPLWAGSWGNALHRGCTHRSGLDEPTVIDSYLVQRACLDIFADVYVPGLTDGSETRPEQVLAQVERSVDGAEPTVDWLVFVGRVGNDYRYQWTMPREEMTRTDWDRWLYGFRFSTDGVTWLRIGQGEGPGGGEPRSVVRGFEL